MPQKPGERLSFIITIIIIIRRGEIIIFFQIPHVATKRLVRPLLEEERECPMQVLITTEMEKTSVTRERVEGMLSLSVDATVLVLT